MYTKSKGHQDSINDCNKVNYLYCSRLEFLGKGWTYLEVRFLFLSFVFGHFLKAN